jgi:hypothetical protein
VAIPITVIQAEDFFAHPELAGAITGIQINLIHRFKVILEVISSGYKINTEIF